MGLLIKSIFDDDKFFLSTQYIFVSNTNFTTSHLTVIKNSRFFSLNFQIPGFSRIPGFCGYPVCTYKDDSV